MQIFEIYMQSERLKLIRGQKYLDKTKIYTQNHLSTRKLVPDLWDDSLDTKCLNILCDAFMI